MLNPARGASSAQRVAGYLCDGNSVTADGLIDTIAGSGAVGTCADPAKKRTKRLQLERLHHVQIKACGLCTPAVELLTPPRLRDQIHLCAPGASPDSATDFKAIDLWHP